MVIADNLNKCYFCKILLSEKVTYKNEYKISCCKSNFCKQRLNLYASKILGIESYITIIEKSISKDDLDKYSLRLDKLIGLGFLSKKGFRRMRNQRFVFYKETSRGKLIVGLNYAYCLVDNGIINPIYNLNLKKESISGIKNRLNVEFKNDLDIFLKVLDCRKII